MSGWLRSHKAGSRMNLAPFLLLTTLAAADPAPQASSLPSRARQLAPLAQPDLGRGLLRAAESARVRETGPREVPRRSEGGRRGGRGLRPVYFQKHAEERLPPPGREGRSADAGGRGR